MESAEQTIQNAVERWTTGRVRIGSMLDKLLHFWVWCQHGGCVIRDTHGETIPMIPNRTQRIIFARMLRQAYWNRPIRVVILKARKPGVSTFIQALFEFLCGHYRNQVALMLAHIHRATVEIFDIARLIAESDDTVESNVNRQTLEFPQTRSRYACHTAGSKDFGAGGTPLYLHFSEVALWDQGIKASTESTALRSVPRNPDTIVVYESTARGRELFFQRWLNAKNDDANLYDAVFIPWYFNDENQIQAERTFRRTDEERDLARRAERDGIVLTDDHLQWRRLEILESDEWTFKQEHPSTPEEAVAARENLVLPNLRACAISEVPADVVGAGDKIGGIDFGFYDPTVIGSGYYHDQVVYVERIYREVKTRAEHRAEVLRPYWTYYCDPSGAESREELAIQAQRRRVQVSLLPAPRMQDVSTKNNNPEWDRVARLVRQGRLKIVLPACEQLCVEAETLEWNPATGRPDTRRTPTCGHFDTMDMLRYMVLGATTYGQRVEFEEVREPSRRDLLRI